jgi:hypothetical protein
MWNGHTILFVFPRFEVHIKKLDIFIPQICKTGFVCGDTRFYSVRPNIFGRFDHPLFIFEERIVTVVVNYELIPHFIEIHPFFRVPIFFRIRKKLIINEPIRSKPLFNHRFLTRRRINLDL